MRLRAVWLCLAWLRKRTLRVAIIMSLCLTFAIWTMLPTIDGSMRWTGLPGASGLQHPQQPLQQHGPPPITWYHRRHLAAMSNDTCKYTSFDGLTMVDDLGHVCSVEDALRSGCCPEHISSTEVCDTCGSKHCCHLYEQCVSCCLAPKHVPLRRLVFHNLTEPQKRVLSLVEDQFEYCEAKCRTNSQSVQHENKFRDARYRYCFGPTPAEAIDTGIK